MTGAAVPGTAVCAVQSSLAAGDRRRQRPFAAPIMRRRHAPAEESVANLRRREGLESAETQTSLSSWNRLDLSNIQSASIETT